MASQVVKITSKGQFTLPVEMRRDLSLGEGQLRLRDAGRQPRRDQESRRTLFG